MLMKKTRCTNGTLSRCTYSVLLLVALMSMAFSSTALAQLHGIGIVKGCKSETAVGAPYLCEYTILNTLDSGNGTSGSRDTMFVTGIEDLVCTGGDGGTPGPGSSPPYAPMSDTEVLRMGSWLSTIEGSPASMHGDKLLSSKLPGSNCGSRKILKLPSAGSPLSFVHTIWPYAMGYPTKSDTLLKKQL